MKRKPILVDQLSKEANKLYHFLNREQTDVARVDVGAAFLDATVAGLLAEFMLPGSSTVEKLLSPNGALGAFQVRVDVAYGLGLIHKVHLEELCTIGKIRNHFAHSHLELSFADDQIRVWCDELKAWKEIFPEDSPPGPGPESKVTNRLQILARNKFMMSVVILSQRLLVDARSVRAMGPMKYPRFQHKAALKKDATSV